MGLMDTIRGVVDTLSRDTPSFRPDVEQTEPAPTAEPVTRKVIDVDKLEQTTPIEPYILPDMDDGEEFDFGGDADFVLTTPDEEAAAAEHQAEQDRQLIGQEIEGSLSAENDFDAAEADYFEVLKETENADETGFTVGLEGGGVFMPYDSLEGSGGPDTDIFTDKTIGYGTRILKSWTSNDSKKWPTIDGVPTDIRKGITKVQAESLARTSLERAKKAASKRVPSYDTMTSYEKLYWTDLFYNGGHKVGNKNPKAMKAAKAGFTAEAMVRSFDFIKSGKAKSEGLLIRRITQFNFASSEISGMPFVEEYEWGNPVRVKFAADLTTDKISKPFRDAINKNKGWYTVTKGGVKGENKSVKVDDDLNF